VYGGQINPGCKHRALLGSVRFSSTWYTLNIDLYFVLLSYYLNHIFKLDLKHLLIFFIYSSLMFYVPNKIRNLLKGKMYHMFLWGGL
jgi:hypothetical protein